MTTENELGGNAASRSPLFREFASAMAQFSPTKDNGSFAEQNALKHNAIDVTSLTTVMQSARLSAMENGNLNLRMMSKGEVINHPLNEKEANALKAIIENNGLTDVERFRELRTMFTKIGISEQMSQNFEREMSQSQPLDFGMRR